MGAILHLDPVIAICCPNSPAVGLSRLQYPIRHSVGEHAFNMTSGINATAIQFIDLQPVIYWHLRLHSPPGEGVGIGAKLFPLGRGEGAGIWKGDRPENSLGIFSRTTHVATGDGKGIGSDIRGSMYFDPKISDFR